MKAMPLVFKIPRQQTKQPDRRLQTFAAVITLLEDLYPSDQEFIWRRVGEWKKFRMES